MIDKDRIMEWLKNQKIRKDQLIVLLLVGILFLVITIPTGNQEEKEDTLDKESIKNSQRDLKDQQYIYDMEEQLERILSQMEGVGEVIVMITLKESSERVIEKDLQTSKETVAESDSQGGERTTTSETLGESTIYYGGNDAGGFSQEESEKSPYISKERFPKVEGVVVVADGGDNAVVIQNITEAVQALFGVDTHKIRIVKKNDM